MISGSAAAIGFRPEKAPERGHQALIPLKFIFKKFLRLIIPMILGTFLFVIPTSYIGRRYRKLEINKGDYSQIDNIFTFLKEYAT